MSSAVEQVDVHAAPPSLRAWCLCAVVRRVDTGLVRATVQASTWASLNLVVEGEVHGARGVLPRRFVTAPFEAPFDTVTAGPMRSITLLLQPWTLQALAGAPAGSLGAEPVDAARLDAGALGVLFDVMHEACTRGDVARLWTHLEKDTARVAAVQPELACDALLAGGVEAAARGVGCSSRQYLRRFRHAMGLAPSTWVRISRWESALRGLAAPDGESMAQLSLRHGFFDQAHLARDSRALSKATPARLREVLHEPETPWPLRPASV